MDLRLKEVTWLRLVSLLLWTILVMIKRGVTQLIEVFENKAFDRSERSLSEALRSERVKAATLLPPLDDDLVISQIWPLLHRKVNVSLLWRLRRVSRAWKRSVSNTLEWSALEVVRVDSHGYLRYLGNRHERRPSLQERVEDELRSISFLLSEQLADYTLRPEGDWLSVNVREFGDDSESSTASAAEIVCACHWLGCPYTVSSQDFSRDDYEQSDRERFWDTDTSSSGGSRTYFPRHHFRV